MEFNAWNIFIFLAIALVCFSSCQEEPQTIIFEEENTTLTVYVFDCLGNPLCPDKVPYPAVFIQLFEYPDTINTSPDFLLHSGTSNVFGTYYLDDLIGNSYYTLKASSPDSFIVQEVIRLDQGQSNEVELLFP